MCRIKVDRLKLQSAKLQSTPVKCALKLMSCIFTPDELVNGNPSGHTNSKDESRIRTILKLDPERIKFSNGKVASYIYYVLVIPQNEYGILVITRDRGAAEVEC